MIALMRANDTQNEKKGRSDILSKAGQSFLISLLVSFLLLAGMLLVNTIMGSINMAMQQHIADGQTLIGGQMLITTGNTAYIGPIGEREAIEKMFLTGELDYTNLSVVKQYYDLADMNFVVGILGSLVMLVKRKLLTLIKNDVKASSLSYRFFASKKTITIMSISLRYSSCISCFSRVA